MIKDKLVYGVGVNDADYITQVKETIGYTPEGKRIRKTTWICPFYRKWTSMLMRCYSEVCHSRQPTYVGCYTTSEWHYFMTFRAWMQEQDWQGKDLDKDLLFPGNKLYSPETCVFVSSKVNRFLIECNAGRGELPIGVCFNKKLSKYTAYCMDVTTGKLKHLGLYEKPEQAHKAWLGFKFQQAKMLASQEKDSRVSEAIISRYENYQTI